MAKQISKYTNKNMIVISVTKGLEDITFKRMSEILEEELPGVKVVALSGPNHAEEVSRKIPTATVIASKDEDILKKLKEILKNPQPVCLLF